MSDERTTDRDWKGYAKWAACLTFLAWTTYLNFTGQSILAHAGDVMVERIASSGCLR